MTTSASRHPAVRMGLSVAVATGLYGISFGALSVAAGFDVLQTMALSVLMFTGGSQFAFIGVVAGGGGGGAATGAAALALPAPGAGGGLAAGGAQRGVRHADERHAPPRTAAQALGRAGDDR